MYTYMCVMYVSLYYTMGADI